MPEYRYFVSFVCREGDDGYRYGHLDLSRTGPIRDGDDILGIQETITRRGAGRWHSVIVTNWQRFETEADE